MSSDSKSIVARAKAAIQQYGFELEDPETGASCRGIRLDSPGFERTTIFLRSSDQFLSIQEDDLVICRFDASGEPASTNENSPVHLAKLLDEFDNYDDATKRGE